MIRINLLKNIDVGGGAQVSETKVAEGVVYGEVKQTNYASILLKIVLVCALPYGLNQYEISNLNTLKRDQKKVQDKLKIINKEIQELGAAVEIVKEFQTKRAQFESQIKVIAELSRARLDEIIALDNLQSLMPDRLWLSSLEVANNKMKISGVAITENDITNLIQNLEESVLFSNVIFTSTVEKKTNEGVLQEFEINCTLERI